MAGLISNLDFKDVLSFCGGFGVALLGLFGARSSQNVQRQKNLDDALAQFMEELQKDRSHHIAHASQLSRELEAAHVDLRRSREVREQLQGEVRSRDQLIASLQKRLNRQEGDK